MALVNMWLSTSADDEEAQGMEVEMMKFIRKAFVLHHLPIMVLGPQSLRHKFHTIMYAFFLVAGSTYPSLAAYSDCRRSHAEGVANEVAGICFVARIRKTY